jgi:hypothetical protein
VKGELKMKGVPLTVKLHKTQEYYPMKRRVVDKTTFLALVNRRGTDVEAEWNFNQLGEICGFGWRVLK